MRNLIERLLTFLAVVTALGLGTTTQGQLVWMAGLDDNGWPAGDGGGPNASFVQENGSINPLPGSPASTEGPQGADNDYYFAGTYTTLIPSVTAAYGAYAPVGPVAVNEEAAERAFAAADNDLRYHFNLPGSLRPSDLLSVTYEAINLDDPTAVNTDRRYGIEVYINGVLVQTQLVIRPAQLFVAQTTPQISLASVNAQVGPGYDNIVSLRGINYNSEGGGNWMGIDYVQLNATPGASPLPGVLNIGGNKAGSVTDNGGGSFSVLAGGNDIWDQRDEFTYAYTEVTGDFDVQVRVESLQFTANWTKAGLMARESLSEYSRMAFLRVTPSDAGAANDVRLAYRTGLDNVAGVNGGQHEDIDAANPTPNPNFPNAWLRLVRAGGMIHASNSVDGVAWNYVASQDTATWGGGELPKKLHLGLATSRHSGASPTAAAEYRDFKFNYGVPFSVAGADSRGNPTGVTVSFNNPPGAGAFDPANYTLTAASGPNVTVVAGLRFTTANDSPARDPMTFTLEGTTADPSVGDWQLIASGDTGLATDPGRLAVGPVVPVANTAGYRAYRLLFPTVRDAAAANSMQIGEIELLDGGGNDVTAPGDVVVGVRAVAGSSVSEVAVAGTVANANNYPAAESPGLVIDNGAGTKYLNFAELNTGIIVTPAGGAAPGAPTVTAVISGPTHNSVQLTTTPLVEGATYNVEVGFTVQDSSGEELTGTSASFVHGAGYEARPIRVSHSKTDDSGYYRNSDAVIQGIGDVVALGGGVFPGVEGNTVFEDPIPNADNNERYSSRVSGVLNITTSGNYTFYMSSDDVGFLYLSSDADPAKKTLIASEPSWNGVREYIAGGNQTTRGAPPSNISAPIALQAGGRYYLELFYTEGGGGNNGSATWLPPGGAAIANGSEPIPASAFVPSRVSGGSVFTRLGPVQIVSQPQDAVVPENTTATFSVQADGTPSHRYQWRKNGVNIPGATGRSYTTPPFALSDEGAAFSVVVANEFSTATSASAILRGAGVDQTPPTLVRAGGSGAPTAFSLIYSEPVNQADAETLGNYSVSGGVTLSSATLQADNVTVNFVCSGLNTTGLNTLTVNNVRDRAGTPNVIAAGSQVVIAYAEGLISYYQFDAIPGIALADLFASPKWPGAPDRIETRTSMEAPDSDGGNNFQDYGGQLQGFLTAPVTGDYTFYLAADDQGALYLSTDSNPANKVQIAREPVWAAFRNYIGAADGGGRVCPGPDCNISQPIRLQAGQKYYIEGLVKEAGGGDFISVAWQTPASGPQPNPVVDGMAPIPGAFLSPYNVPASVAPGTPADVTTSAGLNATISAGIAAAAPFTIQWYRDGAELTGETRSSVSLTNVQLADSGAAFYVVVADSLSTVTSRVATLTVVAAPPPNLLSAQSGAFFEKVTLAFDQPMDPISAQDPFSYGITGGASAPSFGNPVLSADGFSVTIPIDAATLLQEDTLYTVTAEGVKSRADVAINPDRDTATFRTPVFSCGFLNFETFNGSPGPLTAGLIGGTAVSAMTSHPTYPNSPSEKFFLPGFDTRLEPLYASDVHENYGGRIRGLFIPPASGNWIFYLRSDDASQLFLNPAGTDAAGAVMLTEEPGCCGAFEAHASAPQALTAGQRYYIEALYKEGGGGDYCQVAARLDTDTTPLSPIPANQLGVYADATGATLNITQQPASQTFLIIPPSGDGAAVLDQDFNSGDGGFTVTTPNTPFSGLPWTHVPAAGSWQVNQESPEAGVAMTTLLTSPSLNVGRAGYVQVSFSHRYSFEGGNWDGGALEISVNGGAFTAVPATSFTAGGYNGAVLGNSASLLHGQAAFVLDSPNHQGPGYVSSTAGLGYMNAGDTVVLRFVYAGDTNTRGNYVPSWEIDSLKVTDGNAPSTAMFTVGASASLPGNPNQAIFYVWQRALGAGFANVPGASGSTLTIAPTAADNGAQFRCVLYIPGAVRTTDVATLTVAQPNTPPQFTCGPSQISTQGFGAQVITGWATDISPHSITRVPITYSADFSALPAGATLVGGKTDGPTVGSGVISNGVLQLTVAENSAWGVFYTPPISALVESYVINLKAYVGGGTCCGDPLGGGATTAADGFSLNVASDLPAVPAYGNPGEDGAGTGVTVQFDTWDNGGGEAPACEVEYAAVRLALVPLNTPHISQGAGVPRYIPIRVAVHANGTIDVDYDGTNVHSGVVLPGYVPAAGLRLGLGARTGGANDNHWMDDLQIEAFSPDASAAEAGQTVSFVVTTDHPEYFSVQPAVSSDGTLSYTPSATASGLAKVTIRAMDNGGTANGGADTSAPCTIDINIVSSGGGVNNPPQIFGKDVYTDQGVPVSFTIDAFDPDGDPLTYMLLSQPPAGAGVLTLNGNVVTYTPTPGYVGMFMFDFKVCDPIVCTFGNNICIFVRPGSSNTPPTARIVATPTSDFAPYLTNDVLISCNYTNASIRLNGFLSSDAESPNSELAFRWFLEPMSLPFAEGVVVSNRLELGTQTVRLDVTDPQGATGSERLTLDVITVKEAIDISIERVEDYDGLTEAEKRKFIEILKVAGVSAERDHVEGEPHGQLTVLLLELFQYKVYQDLYPIDPVEAECWILWTEDIIQAELICAIECDYAHTQNPQ